MEIALISELTSSLLKFPFEKLVEDVLYFMIKACIIIITDINIGVIDEKSSTIWLENANPKITVNAIHTTYGTLLINLVFTTISPFIVFFRSMLTHCNSYVLRHHFEAP